MKGRILTWTGNRTTVASERKRFNFNLCDWLNDVAPWHDIAVKISVIDHDLVNLHSFSVQQIIQERVAKFRDCGSKTFKVLALKQVKGAIIFLAPVSPGHWFLTMKFQYV